MQQRGHHVCGGGEGQVRGGGGGSHGPPRDGSEVGSGGIEGNEYEGWLWSESRFVGSGRGGSRVDVKEQCYVEVTSFSGPRTSPSYVKFGCPRMWQAPTLQTRHMYRLWIYSLEPRLWYVPTKDLSFRANRWETCFNYTHMLSHITNVSASLNWVSSICYMHT